MHQHDGIWGRKHFRWLPDEDAFLPDKSGRLPRFTNVTTTRRIGYRAPKGSCVDCGFRSHCAPSGRERTVHRLWEQDLVEAALELTATPLGRQRLAERKVRAEGVFNYDVVAGDARPLVMGSAELLDRAETLAEQAGLDVRRSNRPRDIASDHRSFLDAGIPALMLTSPDFDRIHTAGDTLANLVPTSLETIAALGFALLQEAGQGR